MKKNWNCNSSSGQSKASFFGALLLCFPLLSAQGLTTEQILQEFVQSYRSDPMAMDATFGIKVDQDWWYVVVERKEESYLTGQEKQYTFHNYGPNKVELFPDTPPEPTWYFRISDFNTLKKIADKEWTASTAAAKSTPSDEVAMDIEDMSGFRSDQETTAIAYLIMEHFWKKDQVEVTRFSRQSSLPSHGASIVSLYTMKDKRIAWFSLGTEEVANNDRGLERSQIPNLFIITKGKGKAYIGEEEINLEPGMSVFVGPYVKHVFYNPFAEPMEGILVLFGDNIDYALGQSYLSFLENEYHFYLQNERKVRNEKELKDGE
ncbi:MAG: cupin domain-containing protein [Saprospiraceae bacterium]|nr:cupin domain-containing protein [Saprospiraceae bacterium]